MVDAEDNMKLRFDEEIKELLDNKRADNSAFMTAEEYNSRNAAVKIAKEVLEIRGSKKSMTDYRVVQNYGVFTVNNEKRLVRPIKDENSTVLHYVTNESLYDVIYVRSWLSDMVAEIV